VGRSHRTTSDGELIRWATDVARVEGTLGSDVSEVGVCPVGGHRQWGPESGSVSTASAARNEPRRPASGRRLRPGGDAPGRRFAQPARAAIDQLASSRSAVYADALATYGRVLQQRNSLLRSIREEAASRDELRFWDGAFLDAGGVIVAERLRLLEALAEPLAAAHAEIAPDEGAEAALGVRYVSNAPPLPGETPRDALERRLVETNEKEIWNGSTLVGPHRDDISFELAGRDLAAFASRGQQRTAILAFKLAELDLLTALDGRPPLLLLDDVFSELDPERRSHLVRRIAALPQAFVTTTTLDDLDQGLRAIAHHWEVRAESDGAGLIGGAGVAS
jgi:DNA replication and repair protein RecF